MEFSKINIELNFLFILFFSSIVVYFCFVFGTKFSLNLFPKVKSNEKTSIYHETIYRGFGILYLIPLISTYFYSSEVLSKYELILIILTTLLGYLDDKYDLSQKTKLILLILIFINSFFFIDLNIINLLLSLFLFLFFVLFFNQIDGINGICSTAFLLFIFTLFFYNQTNSIPIEFIIIISIPVLIYLNFNTRLKVAMQGDSGSYFMGVLSYVLINKSFDGIYSVVSFMFILPLLLDIVITTLIRIFLKKSIFVGHRDNLYQKFAIKFKSHTKVFSINILLQFFISLLIICFNILFTNNMFYVSCIFIILIMTSIIVYLQFIHFKEN